MVFLGVLWEIFAGELRGKGLYMGRVNDTHWLMMLDLCKRYAAENDMHLPPPQTMYEGRRIGRWYQMQTRALKTGSFSEMRKALWEEFQGSLQPRKPGPGPNDPRWMESYKVFARYVAEFQRTPPPLKVYDGYPIGAWFYNQVQAYRCGALSEGRQALLSSVHPAWQEYAEGRRSVERQLLAGETLYTLVPDGDICIDRALRGRDLDSCLSRRVYGCRQYLETFGDDFNGECVYFEEPAAHVRLEKMFGPGVFSLENRKAVFETLFPQTSFHGFNLLCAAFGLEAHTGSSYVQDASLYNQRSGFTSPEEMDSVFVRALDTLSDQQKAVLSGRFYGGLTRYDFMEQFACSYSRVGFIENNGLEKLRWALIRYGVEPCFDGTYKGLQSDSLMDVSIAILGLSDRAQHALLNGGIFTVGDLSALSQAELKGIRNVGAQSVVEIERKLADFLHSRDDDCKGLDDVLACAKLRSELPRESKGTREDWTRLQEDMHAIDGK